MAPPLRPGGKEALVGASPGEGACLGEDLVILALDDEARFGLPLAVVLFLSLEDLVRETIDPVRKEYVSLTPIARKACCHTI